MQLESGPVGIRFLHVFGFYRQSFKGYLSLLMAVWGIEVEISEVSEIFFL
jgi:hypothetical protein